MLDFPGIGTKRLDVWQSPCHGWLRRGAVSATHSHYKNKNLLPAETRSGGCEYRRRNLTNYGDISLAVVTCCGRQRSSSRRIFIPGFLIWLRSTEQNCFQFVRAQSRNDRIILTPLCYDFV